MKRRSLLTAIGLIALPGCSQTTTPGPTSPKSPEASSSGGGTCNPENVTRPPLPDGNNPEPSRYPEKPATLSIESVTKYLLEFETAFAQNRTINNIDVNSVTVDIQGGFDTAEVENGFVASSNVQIMYTTDGSETETITGDIKYISNYFVNAELVYRAETDSKQLDPRDSEQRLLVQCGSS